MATLGSGGLVWLMLLLDTFLLPPVPVGKGVPARDLFRYIPPSASVVAHLDIRSMKKQLDSSIEALQRQPFVTKDPILSRIVAEMDRGMRRGLRRIERRFKVLKLKQIRFVTLALTFRQGMRNPSILLVVDGDLNQKMIDSLIQSRRMKVESKNAHGHTFYYSARKRDPAIAWTSTGQILMATPDNLQRLEKKAFGPGAKGSAKAQMMANYRPNHAIALGFHPTDNLRAEIRRVPAMIRSLFNNLDSLYASAWGGGSLLSLRASDALTRLRYKTILAGLGQLSVAGDHFRRGLLDIADGVLVTKGVTVRHPMLASLAQHKDVLFRYVRDLFGKSRLTYQVTSTKQRVQLRFRGNGGVLIPMVGFVGGFLTFARKSSSARAVRAVPKAARPMKQAAP